MPVSGTLAIALMVHNGGRKSDSDDGENGVSRDGDGDGYGHGAVSNPCKVAFKVTGRMDDGDCPENSIY